MLATGLRVLPWLEASNHGEIWPSRVGKSHPSQLFSLLMSDTLTDTALGFAIDLMLA